MAHFRAPDKVPARRRAMIAQAGELKIPFTSGVLVGIGESAEERRQAIRALAVLHRAGDHLQEVIIQPFRPHPGTPMQCAEAAPEEALIETVCQARISLPSAVSVQAPPNLAAGAIEALIAAGINDFGGISPVTPDFINPGYPWPQIDALRRRCEAAGFALRPRLPIYPRFVSAPGWLEPALVAAVAAHRLEAA
jgi:FO synthase